MTVLGSWPRHASIDSVFLSNAPGGDLFLAGASSRNHHWVGVRVALPMGGGSPTVPVFRSVTPASKDVDADQDDSAPEDVKNVFVRLPELLRKPSRTIGDCL